jgi:hypothetical protein
MSIEQKSSANGEHSRSMSRRSLLGCSMLSVCAAALEPVAQVVLDRGWTKVANADEQDPLILLRDTMNGLVAFIVPGPDSYSVHQGVSTTEPGGIDANIVDVLIASFDKSQPAPPPFPSASIMVATVLNNIAMAVNPSPPDSFPSAFACLSFQEKVGVFAAMEADPSLRSLAGLLPTFVGFLSYSEAGVFDPVTRTLTGQPVGWTLSGYEFEHGHDEFKGYYQNRISVAGNSNARTESRGDIDHA